MDRMNNLLRDAGKASPREVVAWVSHLAEWKGVSSLGSGGCLQTLAPEANGGAKKVIAQKVSGSVKWYNVKHGYGFINRHDTKEEIFVHHSAITQSGSRRYHRGVDAGEAVEFDVVQGKQGIEAANVTGPAGAPVKGTCFSPGFCIRHDKPQPHHDKPQPHHDKPQPHHDKLQPLHDAGDTKEDIDSEDGREGFLAPQGQKHHQPCRQPQRPQAQELQRFPSFRRLPAATHHPATVTAPAPAAEPVGTPPHRRHGPSYQRSRPRGRGAAPGPKPSPNLTQELEAEKEESSSDAIGLQQGAQPRYTCHCANNLCDRHRLQQLPGKEDQKPKGGEGEIRKGPAGKPSHVAEKSSTSEEKATVEKAFSAAQAQ